MIGIEHVWGACGLAVGVVFTVIVMVASIIYDDRRKEKRNE